MSYIWPVVLIVFANVLYQVCAKSIPKEMDVMASMTVTYLVGAVCSALLYFLMRKQGTLLQEYGKLNAAPFLLGMCVVGLEVGFIYAYQAGWNVGSLSTVQSAFLAAALVFVGALVYHEAITPGKIAGVLICMAGIYLINRG